MDGMLWYYHISRIPYHITRLLACTLNSCRPYRYMAAYYCRSEMYISVPHHKGSNMAYDAGLEFVSGIEQDGRSHPMGQESPDT